jgi:tRNA threonylcarbamoyladenosine biosynthesis protein TsaB
MALFFWKACHRCVRLQTAILLWSFLKMKLLAIETATETVSVAVGIDGEIRENYLHAPRRHAELLLPWVKELMADAGIGFAALDAIAFSRGPGSFTSLRIGIGIVQGLAWASDRPVVPVSSLAAAAQTVAGAGVKSVIVALDARMNEVFTGTFEADAGGIMRLVGEEEVLEPADVELPSSPGAHAVGIGFARYPVLMEAASGLAGVDTDVWPRASSVIQLAQDWLGANQALPAERAQPVYLRNEVAKKPRA